jgi:16S rRNA (adenine1518-N6/adenine1519-N6)-dimethyltransferase
MTVQAKKFLGQHFLKDLNIAEKIAQSLTTTTANTKVIEVGPGMGVLTQFLLKMPLDLSVIEIDRESVTWLKEHFPALEGRIIEGDFLQLDLKAILGENGAIIGNFPYNISSQILFHCLENRESVKEVVGMFQKEVAERVASKHGNKTYGILSVLLQVFYTIEYLFTVSEQVFQPPPKVKSGVIRLIRKDDVQLGVTDQWFKTVVKTGFNQRRKTLRNALKPIMNGKNSEHLFMEKRAEQLSPDDFIELAKHIQSL